MFIAYIENSSFSSYDLHADISHDIGVLGLEDARLLRLSALTYDEAEEEVRQNILDPALANLDDDLETIIFEVSNEWKINQKRKEPK